MDARLDQLKSACPMPALLHKIGLGEFAKASVSSPFREDKEPSWGIFQREGKWFFKDQATGDSGDEITLLARWKGLDHKRDFPQLIKIYADLAGVRLDGHRRRRSPSTPGAVEASPFAWSTCVAAVGPAENQRLVDWRGYSPEFCECLRRENVIGLYKGNWALPVHGETGVVLGCHYRVDRGQGTKAAWFYYPKGVGVRPLLFGDPTRSEVCFAFESPWDAFAVMDKLGWHLPNGIPKTAIVITRGAGNGKIVTALFRPTTTVYAFKQNDQPKNGKTAADEWLAEISNHAGCTVHCVLTPAQFKDPNDWTRAGATGEDITAAIVDSEPMETIAGARVSAPGNKLNGVGEPPSHCPDWPAPLEAAAFHGVAGEFVRRLEPHTEADPAAILFQFLGGFGNLIGRTAFFTVEAQKHFTNINVTLVGKTSKARKGISWGRVYSLLRSVDPSWKQPASGMSTGEGLIWAVRDPILRKEPIKKKGKVVGYEDVIADAGVEDKRLFVVEEEFARPLKCANREHNTLSAVFRQAYDSGNLRTLTRTSPAEATGAHISSVGHITKEELTRHLTNTECANGYANRILWVCVSRSKELPEGGNAHLLDFSDIEERLKEGIAFAQNCGELRRDTEARELWRSVYHDLSTAKPGLFGAVTSRAEAYVTRISLIYAVLDRADFIRREHLEAAIAAWRYCEDSARYIFGDSLGDPDADAILAALRRAGGSGLTRTDIANHVFDRHGSKGQIDHALTLLVEFGVAECKSEGTRGRTAERWVVK